MRRPWRLLLTFSLGRVMHMDRMSKLLALAGSPNDHEALAALRLLKRLLATEEMDFVDLATLVHEKRRAEELESDLEATKRQLRQTQLALRTARSGNQGNQVVRELRQEVQRKHGAKVRSTTKRGTGRECRTRTARLLFSSSPRNWGARTGVAVGRRQASW